MIKIDTVTISELVSIPWFKNCGQTPTGLSMSVRQLNNWIEVRAAAADLNWINATEEAQGQLTEYLSCKYPNDYQGIWNRLVREVRSNVDSTVVAKADAVAAEYNLGQAFVDAVKWDVLNAVMEISYKSKHPPCFFDKLLEIYRAGHYPCGLEDDGTIVIY